MKWLSTVAVILAMGMAGIYPDACAAPQKQGSNGASISKVCSCCQCGGDGACCMRSSDKTPAPAGKPSALPAQHFTMNGLLPSSPPHTGEFAIWGADISYRLVASQCMPDARHTYARIQVFLI